MRRLLALILLVASPASRSPSGRPALGRRRPAPGAEAAPTATRGLRRRLLLVHRIRFRPYAGRDLDDLSGYTGGRAANPTYEQVSAGGTGHIESVRVVYDPRRISYATPCRRASSGPIDPLDGGGQFCDRGDQYRSAIFVANAAERRVAEAAKAAGRAPARPPGRDRDPAGRGLLSRPRTIIRIITQQPGPLPLLPLGLRPRCPAAASVEPRRADGLCSGRHGHAGRADLALRGRRRAGRSTRPSSAIRLSPPRARSAPGSRIERLETLWINTGTLCNLACTSCYIESSPTNDALVYLSLAEAEDYFDQAAALGTRVIGFTGGEPFMNRDMVAMMRAALARGFELLVLTNAMRPMRRFEAELAGDRRRAWRQGRDAGQPRSSRPGAARGRARRRQLGQGAGRPRLARRCRLPRRRRRPPRSANEAEARAGYARLFDAPRASTSIISSCSRRWTRRPTCRRSARPAGTSSMSRPTR